MEGRACGCRPVLAGPRRCCRLIWPIEVVGGRIGGRRRAPLRADRSRHDAPCRASASRRPLNRSGTSPMPGATPVAKARSVSSSSTACARTAKARGIRILRDKEQLGLGDSISKFIGRLGAGNRVFVILSRKYALALLHVRAARAVAHQPSGERSILGAGASVRQCLTRSSKRHCSGHYWPSIGRKSTTNWSRPSCCWANVIFARPADQRSSLSARG